MSYCKNTQIIDALGNLVDVTPYGEIRSVEPIRISGGVFSGSTINTVFFLVTNTNGGTTTASNSVATLSTNTTANGATNLSTSQLARFVGGTGNRFYANIYLGDSGTANNTRRWGMMNVAATDGVYFKLAGTVLSVCTLKGGVETSITITPSITLTNLNRFEIEFSSGFVYFAINGIIAYQISPTSPYANTLQLGGFADNTNSGGSTTNVVLNVTDLTVYRVGHLYTQPVYARVTTEATQTVKYGPGILHRITLNDPTGTLITLYDNTSGSGTTIAVINTPAQADPVTLVYGCQFSNGLTIVSTGTWDATVIFE